MDLELEKKRAYAREYYYMHKEKIRAYQKKYYQSHKDKFRDYYRKYAIKNYARILKVSQSNIERYLDENPDYYKELRKKVLEKHPGYFAEYYKKHCERWRKGGIYYKYKRKNGNKISTCNKTAPQRA